MNETNDNFEIMMPQQATSLTIQESTLPLLGDGVCSYMRPYTDNIQGMEELYLEDLSVEKILSNAFQECDELKILILKNNKIKTLSETVFNRNLYLEKLDLSRNLIEELPSKIFSKILQLRELYLSENNLKTFNPNLIEFHVNLKHLRLDSNDLFDLNGKKMVQFVPDLKIIAINNNQLRCGRVKEIIDVFDDKYVSVDINFEGIVKERVRPIEIVASIICLGNVPWTAAHYIYTYKKVMEIN